MEIYTLGSFSLHKGERIITEEVSRTSKRWKLFQYLLTFPNREISREELIAVLDLDNNSDPRGSLTALVYRLRRLLGKYAGESEEDYILTRGSAYTFNNNANYWLDAEEFARLCSETRQYISEGLEKSCNTFKQAMELYEGNYLDELNSEEWIWNARNRYRDMLVSTLQELADFMSKEGFYGELWQFYEQAQAVIQFDEELIKGSIEALLGTGNVGLARIKYEEAVSMYEDNNLILPPGIKKLKPHLNKEKSADPSPYLKKVINRSEVDGAYVCGPETFTVLYDLEKRRSQREVAPRYLVHLRLTDKGEEGEMFSSCKENELVRYGENLLDILQNNLRCGDVVCRWSKEHFIILLVNLNNDDARKVLARVDKSFKAKNNLPKSLKIENRFYQL